MSAEDDKDDKIPKLVSWNENRSLCEAYRDKPVKYGNLTKEERAAKEEKDNTATAKRLARKILALRKEGRRAKDKNSTAPVFRPLAYRPEGSRLLLAEDLSLHQLDMDVDWELQDRERGSISVYCDLRHQTSELFLSNAFQYRHGRPYDIKTDQYLQSNVKNTSRDLSRLPPDYRDFVHSQKATCVCKCADCRKNSKCECALLAKLLNKGLICLKNNKAYIDNEMTDVNHEELTSLGIGCGQACHCYQHRNCDKNVDLLHHDMPKLEVFRRDPIVNFGIVFDSNLDFLTRTFIDEIEKNAEYRQFRNIYNDLKQHADDLKKKTVTAHISPLVNGNVAQFVSHGCLPNLEVLRVMANHALPQFHRLFLVAARHIEAGEELFISYGSDYVKHRIKKCLCGQPLCLNGPNKNYIKNVSNQKLEEFLRRSFLPKCRKQAELTDGYLKGLKVGGILSRPINPDNLREDLIEIEDVEKAQERKIYHEYIFNLKQERANDIQTDFQEYEETKIYAESSCMETVDYFSSVKVKREPSDIIEIYQQPIDLDVPIRDRNPPMVLPIIKVEPGEHYEEKVLSSEERLPSIIRRRGTVDRSRKNPGLSPRRNWLQKSTVTRATKHIIVSTRSSSSECCPTPEEPIPSKEPSEKVEKAKLKNLKNQQNLFAQLGIKPISHEMKSFRIPIKKRLEISSTDRSTSNLLSTSSREQPFPTMRRKRKPSINKEYNNRQNSVFARRWKRDETPRVLDHGPPPENWLKNAVKVDQYHKGVSKPRPSNERKVVQHQPAVSEPYVLRDGTVLPHKPQIHFTDLNGIALSQPIVLKLPEWKVYRPY